MRRRGLIGWGLLACGSLLALAPLAWACPGCKEALFDPRELPQRLSTARGYALSIGLLLAVPALAVGGITLAIVRTLRRAQRPPEPSPPGRRSG